MNFRKALQIGTFIDEEEDFPPERRSPVYFPSYYSSFPTHLQPYYAIDTGVNRSVNRSVNPSSVNRSVPLYSSNLQSNAVSPTFSPPPSHDIQPLQSTPVTRESQKTPLKKRRIDTSSPSHSPSNRIAKQLNIGKKKLRKRWTDDETRILIEVYSKWAMRLRKDKKASTWELVRKQFDLRCKQEDVDTDRSSKQIQDRIDYLINQYKQVVDNNNATGRGRKKFKWEEAMRNILCSRSAIVPTNVSESDQRNDELEPDLTVPPSSSHPRPEPDSDINPDTESESDSDVDNEQPRGSKRRTPLTKQGAIGELVDTMKTEMANQAKELKKQNKFFRRSAEADRKILQKLTDLYQADSEASSKLATALANFLEK